MVQQSEKRIEKYLVYIIVGISLIAGSFGTFFFILMKL